MYVNAKHHSKLSLKSLHEQKEKIDYSMQTLKVFFMLLTISHLLPLQVFTPL